MPNQYDVYENWGFRENPFQPSPLHPTARGERLLVGRDEELSIVKSRLHKTGKITCVEGTVGIGKTSLVNIAAFQCLQGYLKSQSHQLLVPCLETFQLQPKDKSVDFCARVYLQVAQTLINQASAVKSMGLALNNMQAVNA